MTALVPVYHSMLRRTRLTLLGARIEWSPGHALGGGIGPEDAGETERVDGCGKSINFSTLERHLSKCLS